MKANVPEDKYIFLETTDDDQTQNFIKSENISTAKSLEQLPSYESIKSGTLEMLSSNDKIPAPSVFGDTIITVWRDKKNPQGIIRSMSYDDYLKYGAKDSLHNKWNVILDLDKVSKEEGRTWVLKNYEISSHMPNSLFLKLSDGGKDASYFREFHLKKMRFIEPEEGGYYLPENKFYFSVKDKETIHISTSFENDFKSTSGYPLTIKAWKRGDNLSLAQELFRADESDLFLWNFCKSRYDNLDLDCFYVKAHDFYSSTVYLNRGEQIKKVDLDPTIKFVDAHEDQIFFEFKKELSDYPNYTVGEIVSLKIDDVFSGKPLKLNSVFRPNKYQAVEDVFSTSNHVYFLMSENVSNKLYKLVEGKLEQINFPDLGSISVTGKDYFSKRDDFFVYDYSFLRPYGLYHMSEKSGAKKLRTKKELFDATPYKTQQFWATSKDGTKVPYFIVSHKDLELNHSNPVWIYAYGGFESSMTPWYSGTIGRYWLKQGGVYVVANIRGGGEFGPNWHRQALKTNRNKTYEDYFAVAEDLIERKITRKGKIGISGGSNGGLLTGVGLTQRPDLYGAVISSAPLLDMFRYHKLPPGDSWVAEYGNVDEETSVHNFWAKYSPYQALSKDKNYPPTLIMTSSSDDRVHPGHARKMAAKMKEYNKNVLFYENVQGGHSGSANLEQRAHQVAYEYSFFYKNLMDKK